MSIANQSESFGTREVYSVDGVRVTVDAHHGWRCDCTPAPAQGARCTHIERANVFKQMRGVKRHDDNGELRLNTPQLPALEHTAIGTSAIPEPVDPVRPSKQGVHLSLWAAVVAVLVVSGISSGVTYLATSRAQPTSVVERHASKIVTSPVSPNAESRPTSVNVVNPFDATEVFEFPPSTSDTAARDAVREFLLKRARERLASAHKSQRMDEIADAGTRCQVLPCSTPLIRTAASSH